MPINIRKAGTSAVYGLVDIGTELVDAKLEATNPNIRKPFQNVTDIQRAAAALGGVAATYLVRDPAMVAVAEDVYVASIPLFEKSLARAIMTLTSRASSPEGRFTLRQRGIVEVPQRGPRVF